MGIGPNPQSPLPIEQLIITIQLIFIFNTLYILFKIIFHKMNKFPLYIFIIY